MPNDPANGCNPHRTLQSRKLGVSLRGTQVAGGCEQIQGERWAMKTTMPKLPSGATGFINDKGQWQCTGSQMGRRDTLPENRHGEITLQIERLKWVDGDYDQGGAYWGNSGGTSIYRARGDMEGEDSTVELFVRATCLADAKRTIVRTLPNAKFES